MRLAAGGERPAPRDGLDGSHSCHIPRVPLAYAAQDQRVIDVLEQVHRATQQDQEGLKAYEPDASGMIYQGKGAKARACSTRANCRARTGDPATRSRREEALAALRP